MCFVTKKKQTKKKKQECQGFLDIETIDDDERNTMINSIISRLDDEEFRFSHFFFLHFM